MACQRQGIHKWQIVFACENTRERHHASTLPITEKTVENVTKPTLCQQHENTKNLKMFRHKRHMCKRQTLLA
jgi:hypothetical protein